jgi:dethiobiotin synthetase
MRRLRGILVVGTDTNVGKTFVATALCHLLRRRGVPVVGLKPFETGCQPEPQDAQTLERAARSRLSLELRCPFRYRAPLAPAVAAEEEGLKGNLADAIDSITAASSGRVAVIESAGGLWVPLDGKHTNLDLAAALRLPVLLVGRNALGTLNHLALSVDALRRRRVAVTAIVLSRGRAPADPSQISNARWARRLTGVTTVISLPRSNPSKASRVLESLFDRPALARLLPDQPRDPSARRPDDAALTPPSGGRPASGPRRLRP